jgi:taurine dioxygenase
VDVNVLSPALGVEIVGVDARSPLAAPDRDRLVELFDRHHLLLLRDQHLTGEQQAEFVGAFGPLLHERSGTFGYVSNVRADGIVREGALLFHSDFAFAREPLLGISLHALEIPTDGAPTWFANAVRAVDLLPPRLALALADAAVANQFDFRLPSDRRHRREDITAGMPITEHPAIADHPRTGVRVLMINEMHSERIVGLDRQAGDALLADVFAVLYGDDNVYVHRWRVGDLVLWDNVAVHHARRSPPPDEARTLQRVTLGRFTPDELVPDLDVLLGRA